MAQKDLLYLRPLVSRKQTRGKSGNRGTMLHANGIAAKDCGYFTHRVISGAQQNGALKSDRSIPSKFRNTAWDQSYGRSGTDSSTSTNPYMMTRTLSIFRSTRRLQSRRRWPLRKCAQIARESRKNPTHKRRVRGPARIYLKYPS